MDFAEVIGRRRMVYDFREEPLGSEVVERILAAGQRAPSAGFSQGFEFLVLGREADRQRFWETAGSNPQPQGVRRAPVLILPFACKNAYLDRYAEPGKGWTDRDEARWPVPYWYIDTGMAALLMLLAAVNEGAGALFFGIPRGDWGSLREAFDVPETFDPIGAVAIGYRAEETSSSGGRGRRLATEVVHRGRW